MGKICARPYKLSFKAAYRRTVALWFDQWWLKTIIVTRTDLLQLLDVKNFVQMKTMFRDSPILDWKLKKLPVERLEKCLRIPAVQPKIKCFKKQYTKALLNLCALCLKQWFPTRGPWKGCRGSASALKIDRIN